MGKCFFKVYLPRLSSNRLRIPVTFLKHIKDEASGTFSLMDPSEKVWNVSLIENTDGSFFEEGWPVFVRDHKIKAGDFIVFKYNGNLHFTVHIYDPSECEKDSAYYACCSQDTTCSIRHKGKKRGISDEAVNFFNDSSYKSFEGYSKRKRGMAAIVTDVSSYSARELTSRKNKCEKNQLEVYSNGSAVSKAANLKDSGKRNSQTRCTLKKESEKHHLQTTTKNSSNNFNRCGDSIICRPRNCMSLERAKEQAHTRRGGLISQRPNVTEQEIERAIGAAMAFETRNPYTVMIMRISHVYLGFFVNLPISFCKSHLPKVKQEMILWDPNGRAWPVTYVLRKGRGAFSGGWRALTYHDNIEADDVCIFELIKANEIQLHIFRVVQEITPFLYNESRLLKS